MKAVTDVTDQVAANAYTSTVTDVTGKPAQIYPGLGVTDVRA